MLLAMAGGGDSSLPDPNPAAFLQVHAEEPLLSGRVPYSGQWQTLTRLGRRAASRWQPLRCMHQCSFFSEGIR